MGNATSQAQQQVVAVLEMLTGPKPVLRNDKFWQQVLAFTTPASRYDPVEVEAALKPHLASLVYNNSCTFNLQRLLALVVDQLQTCKAQGGTVADANAVFLVRTILKNLMEQLNPDQLLSFVELPPSFSSASAAAGVATADRPESAGVSSEFGELAHGSLVTALSSSALQVLAGKPQLSAGNYLLQLEVVHLLLVLCSTQLFTQSASTQLGAHPFLDAIMQQRDLANPVVESLLGYYIRMPTVPLSLKLYIPTDTRTVLRIVRSAAASVLWLPYQAYTLLIRTRTSAASPDSPLGDASLLLLLALTFYAVPSDASWGNPFRQSLQRLQDSNELGSDVEGGRSSGVSGDAAVPYGALYDALGRTLCNERAVLLLYALLHGSSNFHEYCLVRSDLDTLLLPLLELLYSAHQRTANQMYMLLIILLMLSQDSAFAQNVHRVPLQWVPFYKERSMMRTTLGSLLVVLLLRTAHYNLAKLRDVYLHTNTLAALANLAPHMSGLSSHAAQRLVSLFNLLGRRYSKLLARVEGGGAAEEEPTPRDDYDTPLATPVAGGGWGAPPAPLQPPPPQQQQQQQQAVGTLPQPPTGPSTFHPTHSSAPAAVSAAVSAGAAVAAMAGLSLDPSPEPSTSPVAGTAGGDDAGVTPGMELQLYADFLRIVLEIINSILTHALQQNPELVYTLLQRQEVFAPFRDHPHYAKLIGNVQIVVDHFNRKIEEGLRQQPAGEGGMSAEEVLEVVKLQSRAWRPDRLRTFPDLRFTYEEESSPQEFFVPYVWSLAVAHTAIPWDLQSITLFTPSIVTEPSLGELATGGLSPHTTMAHSLDVPPSELPSPSHPDNV